MSETHSRACCDYKYDTFSFWLKFTTTFSILKRAASGYDLTGHDNYRIDRDKANDKAINSTCLDFHDTNETRKVL